MRRVVGILARLGVAADGARAEPTDVDGLGVLVRVRVVSAQLGGIARRVVRGRHGARPTTPVGRASSIPVLLHRAAAPLAHPPVAVVVGPPASLRLAIVRCAQLRDRAAPATAEELREPHPHRECPELDVQRRCALESPQVRARRGRIGRVERAVEHRVQPRRLDGQRVLAALARLQVRQQLSGREHTQRVVDD